MDWLALTAHQPTLAKVPASLRRLAERQEIVSGQTLFRIGDRVRIVVSVIAGVGTADRSRHSCRCPLVMQQTYGSRQWV